MQTQYRIVPIENFRWGVQKLTNPTSIWRKAKWAEVLFYEVGKIEAKIEGISYSEWIRFRNYCYAGKKFSYAKQEHAEWYIDHYLDNEKNAKRHMATPPREYP